MGQTISSDLRTNFNLPSLFTTETHSTFTGIDFTRNPIVTSDGKTLLLNPDGTLTFSDSSDPNSPYTFSPVNP